MPSNMNMPSSFASAAAGQSSTRPTNVRGDLTRGSGDWVRRDNRSTNGTLTLRRTSTNPFASSQSAAESGLTTPSAEVPPLPTATYELDNRYSKNQLLDIFKSQPQSDVSNGNVTRLYEDKWDPGNTSSSNGRGWGKTSDTRDNTHGPDVCWDASGSVQPIGIEEMSQAEKELFAGDVNSPMKPPPQNTNKDANTPNAGINGKKGITQGQLNSPSANRPGPRRRETSDVAFNAASPSGSGRFQRDDGGFASSPFLNRKANEMKEESTDESSGRDSASKSALPFGGLMRSNTSGSAAGGGASSLWNTGTPSAGIPSMGSFGSFALPTPPIQPGTPGEKRSGFGALRGESRLAHLMPKESSEDIAGKAADQAKPQDTAKSWRARPRVDTDPFGEDSAQSGSAALGGGQDSSPPLNQQRRAPGLDTPTRQVSGEFGMSDLPGFRDLAPQRRDTSQQTPQGQDPISPVDTNPYASPPGADRDDHDDNASHGSGPGSRLAGLGGIPEHPPSAFGGLSRGFPGGAFDGSDRSQTSSVGPSKGFPSLGGLGAIGGLGGLSGWPTSTNPSGTPDRERSGFQGAFGSSIFSPMGDLQSPGLGAFGAGPGAISSGNHSIGRGSKLGSLFPAAMQAQMQGAEHDSQSEHDQRQPSGFGAVGRGSVFSMPLRQTDSPMQSGRNAFEDLFQNNNNQQSAFYSADATQSSGPLQTPISAPSGLPFSQNIPVQAKQQSQASSDSAQSQLPQSQQRTMVMPDRMRWVYLDPQGQTQGPWSGLEMHDWYKASFFTADLSVKKVEDAEFEPLGQLIRRIGNSREPFLVPQIGVPHGPATTQAGAPFAPTAVTPGVTAPQPGSVQPPFAGAFPSFGTTLTAEQQNNLERRKQEEQYLMARQREFLAQQQVNMKQMQLQGGLPSALHHHSSAHSLQSQPSFSNITSPIGMPPQAQVPGQGVAGFFDNAIRQPPPQGSLNMPQDFFREEEMARLNLQDRQQGFNAAPGAGQQDPRHAQQVATLLAQRQALEEAARLDQFRMNEPQGQQGLDRLREFEQLRAQHDAEQDTASSSSATNAPIGPPQPSRQQQQVSEETSESASAAEKAPEPEVLSLTQQVQKAASAKQSPAPAPQPDSPWAKVNVGLPMPFPPPPQSTTPLPAPTAQRGRSTLPEALNVESRSRPETPETAAAAAITPSVAPWAKEPTEAPKGPSLKEIQEAEAKKAAKAEEAAAAARRQLLELEIRNQTVAVAPAPGLPTTSTWGASASPSIPSTSASPWAKPVATKAQAPAVSTAASKKTLAEIQKEEELRKQKLAAATAAAVSPVPQGVSGGKRYADLASKPTATPPPAAGGAAWSTVGAGGKVKIPTGPASSIPSRAPSANVVSNAPAAKVVRPAVATRAPTAGAPTGQSAINAANAELTKWAKGSLAKGLNSGMDVDEFVSTLLILPAEPTIIADSVYSATQLMDGRRFAEEFLRRRKLAEKGVIENANTGVSNGFSTAGASSSGGWSEVAKKGPVKEPEAASGFRVVPGKKKGKK